MIMMMILELYGQITAKDRVNTINFPSVAINSQVVINIELICIYISIDLITYFRIVLQQRRRFITFRWQLRTMNLSL